MTEKMDKSRIEEEIRFLQTMEKATVLVEGEKWRPVQQIDTSSIDRVIGLNLSGNKLHSLLFLSLFPKLANLNLKKTAIETVADLCVAAQLTHLDIGGNNIRQLLCEDAPTKLQSLSVSGNKGIDLRILPEITTLTSFYAGSVGLTSLDFLMNSKQISQLDINGNQIENLTALAKLPLLTQVDLSNNPVKDLSPLALCKGLKILSISNTKVEKLECLAMLSNLSYLFAEGLNIKKRQQEKLKKALPNTFLYF